MRALPAKLAAARAVGGLARRAGRGGGTSLPGKVLMRLEPGVIGQLAGQLPHGCAVISATNGKTTSAAMVASVLSGTRLVHNRAGANMAGGIASTLLGATHADGRLEGELGLFEVDEFWLGQLVGELRPRALLLGNLFRDQLDRYGELDTIADRWAEVVAAHAGSTRFVLNADDPLVADLGRGRPGVTYFGLQDDALALPALPHAADSKHCRNCGHLYAYEAVYLAHLGRYACPHCGRRRPELDVAGRAVVLEGIRRARFELQTPLGTTEIALPLPGLYNVYNALGAAALGLGLGAGLGAVQRGLGAVGAAFGRAERLTIGGREVAILLVKNPTGANEVLRTLALEGDGLQLLGVLNDGVADGRDVSWVWDADFELLAPRVGRVVCSGTRAAELAVRLKYAGVDPARLLVQPDLAAGLDLALDGAPGRPLHVLPTYTALLALRELLADRGQAGRYWR